MTIGQLFNGRTYIRTTELCEYLNEKYPSRTLIRSNNINDWRTAIPAFRKLVKQKDNNNADKMYTTEAVIYAEEIAELRSIGFDTMIIAKVIAIKRKHKNDLLDLVKIVEDSLLFQPPTTELVRTTLDKMRNHIRITKII